MFAFLEALDRQLLLFINGCHSPLWDHIMWFISGKLSWAPLYLTLLFFAFRKYTRHWWLLVLTIALAITLADQISSSVLKDGIQRYRPSHNLELQGLLHHVQNYKGGQYGFVSSHAANSFAVAMLFTLLLQKPWVGISLLLWASVVSYSRIYLGVHYPSDIIGGALLGIGAGYLAWFIFQWVQKKLPGKGSFQASM